MCSFRCWCIWLYCRREKTTYVFIYNNWIVYIILNIIFKKYRNGLKRYAYALQYYELFQGKPDVITINEDGSRPNQIELYAPITLCIISENPFFVLYEKILREIYNYYIHDSVNYKENDINCYQFDVVTNNTNKNIINKNNKNKIPIEILLSNLFNNTMKLDNSIYLIVYYIYYKLL